MKKRPCCNWRVLHDSQSLPPIRYDIISSERLGRQADVGCYSRIPESEPVPHSAHHNVSHIENHPSNAY